jgi:ParB family chromosome partitioning protein
VAHAIRCGELLLKAKASMPHGEWQPWLRRNVSFAARTARDYTSLAKLSPEKRRRVAVLPLREALRAQRTPHTEYYTPAQYVEAARKVLGGIDLDPASCAQANKTVRARKFYTKEQDGLAKPWRGRVWMNPPYNGMAGKFVTKLLDEHGHGHVTAAVVLLNGSFWESNWFRPLWDHALLCFADHRVKYPVAGCSSPVHPNIFAYIGTDRDLFQSEFETLGAVVQRRLRAT